MLEDDLQTMDRSFGLFVGQLRPDEMEAFNRLCKQGYARRHYGGAGGFLGLATAERNFTPEEDQS